MSPAFVMLFDVILKIAPDVIKFVEGFVGDGNSISPEHVPQILSNMADLSKAATDNAHSSVDTAPAADAPQSVAHESHAP